MAWKKAKQVNDEDETIQQIKKAAVKEEPEEISKWSVQQFRQIPSEDVIYNAEEKRTFTVLEALVELLKRTEED